MGKKVSAPAPKSKPHGKKQTLSSKPLPKNQADTTTTPLDSSSTLQSDKNQQRLLDVFSEAFNAVLSADNFSTLLQEIKQALFNRDFSAAFGREDYLQAYAARWSPTRAICYAEILLNLKHRWDGVISNKTLEDRIIEDKSGAEDGSVTPDSADAKDEIPPQRPSRKQSRPRLKMLCVGGCAAEHVAFASYLHHTDTSGHITLLDSAPWSRVASLLQHHITTPPQLSKYASAAAKEANKALLSSGQLSFEFTQHDVLSLDQSELAFLIGDEAAVVTLLFTLNELYTNGGIGKTTRWLRTLGDVLPHNSLVLVVDSPGSYSEAAVGKESKKYPMQWLLDHTLLETESETYTWEKLESDESIWYRLPQALSYPIQLENMRYQRHLYRIVKAP